MKIIIVGASSGLGKEMALRYADAGHQVVVTGRRKELLEEVAAAAGVNVFSAVFDVTGTENGTQFQEIVRRLGGLDLLIYNAGTGDPSEELRPDVERQTTQTNVNGFVDIANEAFLYFVKHGCGQIAVTSSVAALRGNSWTPAYSASKAFVSNYAEGLNMKAARLKKNIVVTDIRPGFVQTKMAKGAGQFWVASPEKAAAQMINAIARKKRVAYVTRRWRLIAWLLKRMPYAVYSKIG